MIIVIVDHWIVFQHDSRLDINLFWLDIQGDII